MDESEPMPKSGTLLKKSNVQASEENNSKRFSSTIQKSALQQKTSQGGTFSSMPSKRLKFAITSVNTMSHLAEKAMYGGAQAG